MHKLLFREELVLKRSPEFKVVVTNCSGRTLRGVTRSGWQSAFSSRSKVLVLQRRGGFGDTVSRPRGVVQIDQGARDSTPKGVRSLRRALPVPCIVFADLTSATSGRRCFFESPHERIAEVRAGFPVARDECLLCRRLFPLPKVSSVLRDQSVR